LLLFPTRPHSSPQKLEIMDSIRPRTADAPEGALPKACDEKIEVKDDADSIKSGQEIESDPFVPFPVDPDVPEEKHSSIFSFRAVVVGCILGGLVNASNVYLGMSHPFW
jgi:hypothetical protein